MSRVEGRLAAVAAAIALIMVMSTIYKNQEMSGQIMQRMEYLMSKMSNIEAASNSNSKIIQGVQSSNSKIIAAVSSGNSKTSDKRKKIGMNQKKSVVRDCKTWEEIEFTLSEDDPSLETAELDDYEKNEHRLESWKKDWDNANDPYEPKSGVGSTMENTKNMREGLMTISDFIKKQEKLDTIKFLDSPSGDMSWMPKFLKKRSDIEYTGYDLIPQNIEVSKKNFSAEKNWSFKQFDMIKDRVDQSYDMVLNRHVSIHLGLLDSIQMFHNFIQSGSKYLITTTFPEVEVNDQLKYSAEEVSGRSFHMVNLHLYPFHFPAPICTSPDQLASNQHYAMWRLKDLTRFVQENKDKFRKFEN